MHGPGKIHETDVKSRSHGGAESLRLSFGHAPASAAPIGALRDATVRRAHRHVEWTDRERRAVDVVSSSASEPAYTGVLHTRVLQPDRPRRSRAVSDAADPIVAWKHRRHALAPQPRRLRRQMDAVLARNALARCSCYQAGGVLLPRRDTPLSLRETRRRFRCDRRGLAARRGTIGGLRSRVTSQCEAIAASENRRVLSIS